MAIRKRRAWWIGGALAALLAAGLLWGPKYVNQRIRGNFREVVPDLVYRSAQPSEQQLVRWKQRYGLKTVINLRGVDNEDYAAERLATEEAGVRQIDLDWPQHRLINLADVRALQQAFAASSGPYLVHCGGGVDRSASVSVLAAMALGGQDYATAKAQLKSAYWGLMDADHWAQGRFEQYEEYCRQKGIGTGGWKDFLAWLESVEGQPAPD